MATFSLGLFCVMYLIEFPIFEQVMGCYFVGPGSGMETIQALNTGLY